jgi:hypothetical protein
MLRLSLFVSLLRMIPLSGIAGGASAAGSGRPEMARQAHPLVGSWRMTFFEADGSPNFALCTFGGDGTLVTTEHPVVTPPMADGPIFTSSGHGAWRSTGSGSAAFIFVGFGSDGQGTLCVVMTCRGSIALANDDAFDGEMVASIADPDGNPMADFPGTVRGARIQPEAPADTRSITANAGSAAP